VKRPLLKKVIILNQRGPDLRKWRRAPNGCVTPLKKGWQKAIHTIIYTCLKLDIFCKRLIEEVHFRNDGDVTSSSETTDSLKRRRAGMTWTSSTWLVVNLSYSSGRPSLILHVNQTSLMYAPPDTHLRGTGANELKTLYKNEAR